MNPLISIIVPVYNVENYLDKCLESIVNQSYSNLEIILIDDGSPDHSPQMCDEWSQKDSRVRVIHKQNGGLSSARNYGLREASGDFVYFLDSDDYITGDCIEKMVRIIEQDSSLQMVMGSIKPEPEDESELRYYDLKYRGLPKKYENNISIRRKFFDAKTSIPVNGVNKLINRNFLIENKLFFKEGIIHEDEHWAFFLYRKLECISFLFEFSYIHPVNPDSITNTSTLRNSSKYMSIIFDDFLNNLDGVGFNSQFKYCIDRFYPYYLSFYKVESYSNLYKTFWKVAWNNKKIGCLYIMTIFTMKTLLLRLVKKFSNIF